MKVAELRLSMMLEPIPGFRALVHTTSSPRRRLRWQGRYDQVQLFKEEFVGIITGMDPSVTLVEGPIMYAGKTKVRSKDIAVAGRRAAPRNVTVHELLIDGTIAILHGREFRNLRPIQLDGVDIV